MEDFKHYLSDNPDGPERAAAEQVRVGLEGLKLESKVEEVAIARHALLRRRRWRRILFGAALALLAGAAMLFLSKEQNHPVAKPPNSAEQPMEQEDQQIIAPESPEEVHPVGRKNAPMAESKQSGKLSSPRYSAPSLRGDNQEDGARKALLDALWYTDYPITEVTLSKTFEQASQLLTARNFTNAYVLLQRLERNRPQNDTLRLLKGYCLMEMGEGVEALVYFEKLEERQPGWKMRLQWYRGLSLLLTGDKEKALTVFKEIVSNTSHTYREQSIYAVKLLE